MILTIILAIIGLSVGVFAGYIIRKQVAQKNIASAEAQVQHLLNEAKTKQQELLLEGKDKAMKVIEEAKRQEESRRVDLRNIEQRLLQRESMFDKKLLEFQEKQQTLVEKAKKVEDIKTEVERIKAEQVTALEGVAKLSTETAKEQLIARVEEQNKDDLISRIRKLDAASSEEYDRRAKTILATVVQRCASSHAVETTTTTVQLPSDEMKGRIIGKEGRNIKAIEQMTGTEIIVDDTPNAISVSAFSPVRRQVAKRALDKLIVDGRIHPGRIEEAVEESKRELALEMKKAGEDALFELGIGIAGIDPKLVQILGRLKFRTSYGQNVLTHSIEVARISTMLAEELGGNVAICKKGGLFHDVGKAVDHDMQGAHPEIGYNMMKKFGFPEDIAYQSIAHHEDKPKTLEGVIVKAADAISGARPGARKDSLEQYVQRLEELESVASSFPGVEKVYAIQAGREIRVFVEPKAVDDFGAHRLAREIAQKIESELQYPGEIKVTLIRETRIIEYAR
ncbi:MAG: ribonuclease Y [bacterium]|nr:ribonuclease Y [bacterium]